MRRLLNNIKPHFDRGGRFEKYYALYEMVDTFYIRQTTRPALHRMCAMRLILSA